MGSKRRLLVLAGQEDWCCQQAHALAPEALWFGSGQYREQALPWRQAQQYLGRELDQCVFNAHAGFDPDTFGILSGTVRAGGWLILLTPDFNQWPEFNDPVKARLCVHPYAPEVLSGHYLTRLVRVLSTAPKVTIWQQNQPVPVNWPVEFIANNYPISTNAEQLQAITAIKQVAFGHRDRPLIMTADRGRGKSAVLGLAAGRILAQADKRIVVTAPRRSAISTVLQHAEDHATKLNFIAPDQLALHSPAADLVLIDEAAGIHLQLLEKILRHYKRLVFSSTIHGYEGSGRGFALRFKTLLNHYTPQWRALALHQPVRWPDNDPLEKITNQALLLSAEPAELSTLPQSLQIERLDRAALTQNEALLETVFGLLIQAHYQTRPLDLWQLLDGPNLALYVLKSAAAIVAVALVAEEGGFAAKLATAIAEGRRRPQGHQAAQMLAYQYHYPRAACLRYARIVRIAVQTAWQGQGLGSQLLQGLIQHARQNGLAAITVMFGASPDVLNFWRSHDFTALHIGWSRKAASGSHSVLMLRPLNPAGRQLYTDIYPAFQRRWPYLLATALQELHPDTVLLLHPKVPKTAVKTINKTQLAAFATGRKPYELVIDILPEQALVFANSNILSLTQRRVLIVKVLQQRSWQDCAQLLQLKGRQQVEQQLRQAAGIILEHL